MSSHIFQKDVMGVIVEYAVAHPGFSVVVPSLHWATTYDLSKFPKDRENYGPLKGEAGITGNGLLYLPSIETLKFMSFWSLMRKSVSHSFCVAYPFYSPK